MSNLYVSLISVLIFCSCQSKEELITHSQNIKADTAKYDQDLKESLTQIEPDLFVIDKRLSKKFMSGKNLDFFQSETDGSKLFFVPYTDGSITNAILTKNNLPEYYRGLLNSEKLNIDDAKLPPVFINDIISKKGISIHSVKTDILSIFGKPIKLSKKNNLDLWKWRFTMKEPESVKTQPDDLQPFILDSLHLEFDISIYFKGDSIETLIYEYQVP